MSSRRVGAIVLSLGILVAALSVVLWHDDEGTSSILVRAWHYGDRLTYRGDSTVELLILPPRTAVLADGRNVQAVPVQINWSLRDLGPSYEYISPADGFLIAAGNRCGVYTEGMCPLALADWLSVGRPGLLGASVIANRMLRAGDAWTVTAGCDECPAFHVIVKPPVKGASPQAAVTVQVTSNRQQPSGWEFPTGEFDIGTEHPYPLTARFDEGAYHLEAIERGTGLDISDPIPPMGRLLAAIPVVESSGYPAEGQPLPPHPPWSEARQRASPDGIPPARRCAEQTYDVETSRRTGPLGNSVTYEYVLRETCELESGWTTISYASAHPMSHTPLGEVMQRTWTRTMQPSNPPADVGCLSASPLAWDGVRFSLAHGFIDEFSGFRVIGDCSQRILHITGTPPTDTQATGVWPAESLDFDARTGRLRVALFEPGRETLFD